MKKFFTRVEVALKNRAKFVKVVDSIVRIFIRFTLWKLICRGEENIEHVTQIHIVVEIR